MRKIAWKGRAVTNTPISNASAEKLTRLIIMSMVLNLLIVGYIFIQDYRGRQTLVTASRKACNERGRAANQANADFQNAQTRYIRQVIFQSPSVESDVRGHAKEAVKTFKRTSAILTDLANTNCEQAYPGAKLLP